MLKETTGGALLLESPFYEKALYDCGNTVLLAQSDGCGNISRFSTTLNGEIFQPDSFYSRRALGNTILSDLGEKRVIMLGRGQRLETADYCCDVFLDDGSPAVYQEYRVLQAVPFRLDFGFLCAGKGTLHANSHPWGIALRFSDGSGVDIACNATLHLREIQDVGVHLSTLVQSEEDSGRSLRLVFCAPGEGADPAALLAGFSEAKAQAERYARRLSSLAQKLPPARQAQFAACLNCALSSYKQAGSFRGFFAGVNYRAPLRTYYRDGYFTALAVLPFEPQLVREELCTLALGIGADGRAPSAVIDETQVFWPDHWDAPAFFVMLLRDYIQATGDQELLRCTVKGRTMLDLARSAVSGLTARTDHTGLLLRPAGDRHDWADNVFREGYVTYDEILYFRALVCLAQLTGEESWRKRAEAVKSSINRLLWLEDRGWYVDYRSDTVLEDHLAIDTVLAVLFGVAQGNQARQLLQNMERLLETRANTDQPFGDWGTMCCWPPYRYPAHLVEKSSRPFSYHNGGDWPYWSCLYALAKRLHGLDGEYPLTRWFSYGLSRNWCTPVEYYGPIEGRGSLLQAWSGVGAFVLWQWEHKETLLRWEEI